MATKTLAIDPGASQGFALFDGTDLILCGMGLPPAKALEGLSLVLVERPTSYPGDPTPAKDLITLSIRAGRAAGQVEGMTGLEAEYVEPRTWKGSVAKLVHHPKVWAALRDKECVLLGLALKEHAAATLKRYKSFEDYLARAPKGANGRDIVDAVALGLYAVGRRVR